MSYQQVPDPSSKPYTGGKISAPMVIGGVVLIALLVFIFQNTDSTEVNFLFFDFSAPLWLILLMVAVLGGLLDGVVVRAINKARGKETKKKS